MSVASLLLALVAGLLTTLSPCVLPVLPFVTASSFAKNRWGPLALSAGLLVAFVGVTLLVSRTGDLLGIDPNYIRRVSGVLLAAGGVLFVSARLSERFTVWLSGLTGGAASLAPKQIGGPIASEFIGGLLLGVVWTPCSGPSLGVALGLASQAGGTGPAFVVLSVFGLGAVIPLILVAYGARRFLKGARARAGLISGIKKIFGASMILVGLLIVLDWDRHLEGFLTSRLPDFWVEFVTKF